MTTETEFWQYVAAKVAPYLKPDSGINPPPPNPPSPPAPPIIPVPVPVPGISSRWDSAPSQWAKWNFITAAETTTLENLHGVTPIAQRINWYQGNHRLDGIQKADKTYWFVNGYTAWGTPNWVQDIGGAADAKHLLDLGKTPEIDPLG